MSELMTVDELRKHIRFSRKTIYRLLKEKKIPAVKIGNKWRFDRVVIDKWIHQDIWEEKARILIIDDDPSIRLIFEKALEKAGYVVVSVSDGRKGYRASEHRKL